MDNNSSSSDNNRIGHQCWYRDFEVSLLGRLILRPWRQGILRAWSTDHEEFESGPGQYPAAVVEDVETKGMRSTHVCRVTFQEEMPSDEQKLAP